MFCLSYLSEFPVSAPTSALVNPGCVKTHLAHLDVGQTVLAKGILKPRPFKALLSLWPLGTYGVQASAIDDGALKGTAEFSLGESALAELCAISSCRNVSRVCEEPPT